MPNTLQLHRFIVLLLAHYLWHVIQACPDDSLYIPCRNGGWEPSSCSSPSGLTKVIAFGYYPTWSYYEHPGGIDLACTTTIFGDPVDHDKQCCKLQYDLSGESGLSPVVNIISCGEAVEHYFKQATRSDTHFWKFTLNETSLVSITNCETMYDTQMYLRDYLGQRVPNSVVGCDGDDCNCPGWFNVNEAFVDVTLASGDYYIEIKPYDQYTAAGVFHLSLSCTAAPVPITSPTATPITPPTAAPSELTNAPTPPPTVSGPTTPAPTGSTKRFCGKTENWWCYDIDLYPSLTEETNHTVFITNGDDNTQTVFVILATIYGNHCVKPSVLFSFEEIDFSHTEEYIALYDNDQSLIAKCNGTRDSGCGHWIDCLEPPQALGVNKINEGETYSIYVVESPEIAALCTAYHPYSINAKVTMLCSADSASPTAFPAAEPTSAPSASPTSAPSNIPTLNPSTAPSTHPTYSPSDSPSSIPTLNPSTAPSTHPIYSPSYPSKDPTKRPTPGSPTSGQSKEPTRTPNNEDADDDVPQNDAPNQGNKGENTTVTIVIACVTSVAVSVLLTCLYYKWKGEYKHVEQREATPEHQEMAAMGIYGVAKDANEPGQEENSYSKEGDEEIVKAVNETAMEDNIGNDEGNQGIVDDVNETFGRVNDVEDIIEVINDTHDATNSN